MFKRGGFEFSRASRNRSRFRGRRDCRVGTRGEELKGARINFQALTSRELRMRGASPDRDYTKRRPPARGSTMHKELGTICVLDQACEFKVLNIICGQKLVFWSPGKIRILDSLIPLVFEHLV